MRLLDIKRYYAVGYFSVFLPAQLLWRLWTILVYSAKAGDFCETFSMALVNVHPPED